MTVRVLFGAALALSLAAAPLRAAGKVEPIGAFAGPASESVKGALEPSGYRVSLEDGSVACEIWLRKGGPGLEVGALVGVVSFAKATSDFRGQAIKPGSYTLRYAQQPNDGNHLGTAPTTDFLLLVPLADDADASAKPAFADLVRMSAKSAGANHPAPLNLAVPADPKAAPAVVKNEHGHEVFQVALKAAAGDVPLALVVKGQTDH